MERKTFEDSLLDPLEWMKKDKEEVERLLGPETAAMVGFDQRTPHHCYTLFEHVLRTVEGLPKDCPSFLRTAAFFHDIGKPASAKEVKGRLTFHGHAAVSAQTAEPILKDLGYSAEEAGRILFYIAHHDDFISWCLPEESGMAVGRMAVTKENVKKYAEKVKRGNVSLFRAEPECFIWDSLLDLSRADIGAQSALVYVGGVLADSMEHKLIKLRQIEEYIQELCAPA